MINCLTFRKKLNEYIHEPIAEDIKQSMDEHVENCLGCKVIYEEEMLIEEAFHEAISSNINFTSSRVDILKNIDHNRYKKTTLNKLYFHIKKSAITYAASAAAIICFVTGGMYLYNFYNNPNRAVALKNDNPSFISQINYYTGSVIDNSASIKASKNSIETLLPLPKLNDCTLSIKNMILNLTEDERKELTIGYSDRGKIVINNNNFLLAYSYNGGIPKYYAGFNFNEVLGENSKPKLSYSPNGEYVLLLNEQNVNSQGAKISYILDLNENELLSQTIELSQGALINWSSSSNYLIVADNIAQSIILYDLKSGESKTIPFNKGTIKNLFVSDYGDIIVEAIASNMEETILDKYLLKKESSYALEEYYIPGAILKMVGNKVLYYNDNSIFELIDSKNNLIKNLGSDFKLAKLEQNYAIFTDGICNYIYNYDKKFYKYMLPDIVEASMEVSREQNKLAIFKQDGVSILYPENSTSKTEIGYINDKALSQIWYDNNNIVKLIIDNNPDNPLGIALKKVNISPEASSNEKLINIIELFNSNQTGLQVTSATTSKYEDAKRIFDNYMEFLKGSSIPESARIDDYKINTLKLEYGKNDNFNFSIQYSVLPTQNNTYFRAFERDASGWCNGVYHYITVKIKDGSYYIDSISQ